MKKRKKQKLKKTSNKFIKTSHTQEKSFYVLHKNQ